MTRRDILDRVQGRVDDNVYWNDVRLTAILNHLKDKMAQEMRVVSPQYYEFVSVQGQENYEVPFTYVSNHLLLWDATNNKGEIVIHDSPRDIHKRVLDESMEGLPARGYIWGVSGRRQLTIYPTFNVDGTAIKWWFYGWAEDLAVDNDEPQFPLEWHPSLVDGLMNAVRVDDEKMAVSDEAILWNKEIIKIRGLAVTKELLSVGEKTYGNVDHTYPRVEDGVSAALPFTVASADGTPWV